MSKFKIGDIVIGNKLANEYSITTEGWIGKVERIDDGDAVDDLAVCSIDDDGRLYWVNSKCFDLVKCEHRASAGHGIKKVIFNAPATIVLWTDDTKTVVKCGKNDTYDAEKGLALCIAKKYLGNAGNYNNVFKEWLPQEPKDKDNRTLKQILDEMGDDIDNLTGGGNK